ncbi:hypothetical protein LSUE1_G003867 [Lachnellula suecica]|uniref:AB hydrolase-1 domain-containing protein n=1 Tax=Lachnellula suecica TaxID=602035 RepID=A0A8T9C8V7_9HELO|nr:hypothetical protein LSUE1_G003867 [Lachnellula suecica]
MHSFTKLLCLASTISSSLATTSSKSCTDYTITVNPTSSNFIWAAPFRNNFQVVDLLSNIASRTAATSFNPYSGAAVQNATYKISATFCTPTKSTGKKEIVLLLSHGLNFDKSYWDPNIEPQSYSFVDWAIGQGYSVFFYDRLGVGKSSTISGFLNQASIQVSILQQLATAVSTGKYTASFGTPKSLVLVGHSFGSIICAAALAATPDLADGVILTGFNYNATNGAGFLEAFQPRIANGQDPKWHHLDNGYVAPVDIYSNVNAFFKAPDYDLKVVEYAQANRQPFAINEAISGNLVDIQPVNFTGPAMVIAGQFDLIFCTGQCDDVIEHPSAEIFSKAKAFKAVSYPGAGHGLNFAANATGSFKIITDFLQENGL